MKKHHFAGAYFWMFVSATQHANLGQSSIFHLPKAPLNHHFGERIWENCFRVFFQPPNLHAILGLNLKQKRPRLEKFVETWKSHKRPKCLVTKSEDHQVNSRLWKRPMDITRDLFHQQFQGIIILIVFDIFRVFRPKKMSQVVIGGASLVVAAPKVPVFFCKTKCPGLDRMV